MPPEPEPPPPRADRIPPQLSRIRVAATVPSASLSPLTRPDAESPYRKLGKHVRRAARLFKSKGWRHLVTTIRGPSALAEEVGRLPHPAHHTLKHLRLHGAPVKNQDRPWTPEEVDAAARRGCHQSANTYRDFLYGELADMMDQGQWLVLPLKLAKTLPNLRISPIGVVPQHERRPRTIVDYSFPKEKNLNLSTVPLFHRESMQFGRALQRILGRIARADPRHGPVHLSKTDIADGFYNVRLSLDDLPALGVAVPNGPNGEELVAFPLALPMGWVNSPPLFCTATETVADLVNDGDYRPPDVGKTNPQEVPAETNSRYVARPPYQARSYRRAPVRFTDVYMDDFIQVAQGTPAKLQAYRRRLFNIIHQVFRPLCDADPNHRKDPISLKKLLKGDAAWSTRKTVLGWDLDTEAGTIHLTPRRAQRLREVLDDIRPDQRRISLKKWHRVLGELRSMELAVPGLKGHFSTLQEAFRHQEGSRIPLRAAQHDFLADIRYLAASVAQRPTHVQEVVPTEPAILGACDAAKAGMGGVFFPAGGAPTLWRSPFPKHIQEEVVSRDNLSGAVTNSDLELAGTIAHHDVIATSAPVHHMTLGTCTDNTPTLSWQTKGSTTTTGPAAYLLRCQALHQRHFRYQKALGHIPGPLNRMADDASRRFDLNDAQLLTHFNLTYPQELPWQQRPLRPEMRTALICSLRRRRPEPASFLPRLNDETKAGFSGPTTAPTSAWTPTYGPKPTRWRSSWCTPTESERANAAVADGPSKLARWIPSCATWARRSPFWGPLTRVTARMER